MSMLQRITRAITHRSFSTSRIALSAEPSTTNSKPTGLYQFFENNEALPKQNWTGKISIVCMHVGDTLIKLTRHCRPCLEGTRASSKVL
jgi:hypothetical protein